MKYKNIRKFTHAYYKCDIGLSHVFREIEKYQREHNLNLNPDFPRGHIWTEKQQIAYIEYILMEPQSGLDMYFNHPGWMSTFKGDFVLVDGKQRLGAAIRFLNNEIKAYDT